MARNVYTDLVPDHWFSEYKKETTTPERRKEIVDNIFKIIRSVNQFPIPTLDLNETISALRTLTTFDPWGIYKHGNRIELSSIGVMLCSQFYPNIYDVKKQGTSLSMRDTFYDDKKLRRCIEKILLYGSDINHLMGWIRISGCGYCNNFRPTAAKVIYDTNLKSGSKVYDYAAGYGGRLLGAWAAETVDEYVAVDPNTETYNNAIKFHTFLNNNFPNLKSFKIFKMGSEDFGIKSNPEYKNYFDMAFSSPQYFNTEIYSDEPTQSCHKFNNYERWVKGFFRPTIHNCIDVLKPDGIFAINIFVKLPNMKKLIQYICNEKDFKLYKVDKLVLQVMPGLEKDGRVRDRTGGKIEPIFYFKHKDYI